MDKQIRLGWVLILTFLIPLFIYSKTLLPTVGFWDTGEFQTIPYTFDIGHPTGYPTYILLGNLYLKIFPLGLVAWRMNFFSALSVSLGLFVFSILIKKLTNNLNLAVLIPILLSVNPYLWSIAIRADPHALHFLFTSIFVFLSYILIKNKNINYLPLICFLVGLSLGNHMLSIFFIPPLVLIFLFLIKNIVVNKSYAILLLTILVFLLGLSVYTILPIISSVREPLTINYTLTTLRGFKRHVFGEDFQSLMSTWNKGNFKDSIIYYFKLFKNSFPFYLWILVIVGLFTFKRKETLFNFTCILIFLSTIYFSLRYQNAAIERYFITSFLISSIWLTYYLNKLIENRKSLLIKIIVNIFLLICIYTSINNNFSKIDESKNFYAQEWAQKTLSSVEKGSVIFSWWNYSTPLWYFQKVEHQREDVLVINTGANNWETESIKFIKKRSVYFVQEVNLNNDKFEIQKQDNLYKLIETETPK